MRRLITILFSLAILSPIARADDYTDRASREVDARRQAKLDIQKRFDDAAADLKKTQDEAFTRRQQEPAFQSGMNRLNDLRSKFDSEIDDTLDALWYMDDYQDLVAQRDDAMKIGKPADSIKQQMHDMEKATLDADPRVQSAKADFDRAKSAQDALADQIAREIENDPQVVDARKIVDQEHAALEVVTQDLAKSEDALKVAQAPSTTYPEAESAGPVDDGRVDYGRVDSGQVDYGRVDQGDPRGYEPPVVVYDDPAPVYAPSCQYYDYPYYSYSSLNFGVYQYRNARDFHRFDDDDRFDDHRRSSTERASRRDSARDQARRSADFEDDRADQRRREQAAHDSADRQSIGRRDAAKAEARDRTAASSERARRPRVSSDEAKARSEARTRDQERAADQARARDQQTGTENARVRDQQRASSQARASDGSARQRDDSRSGGSGKSSASKGSGSSGKGSGGKGSGTSSRGSGSSGKSGKGSDRGR